MSVPARVRYRERQRLRAGDLRAEQDYLLGLAGRHNVGPHEWGIVRGLALTFEGNTLTVQPGLAIDGYGREIVVFEPVQIELDAQPAGKLVYLFACQRPHGSCGNAPNPRWRDVAKVMISLELLPVPETGSELALVRAAGLSCDVQPSPVLLGEIAQSTSGLEADLSNVRSTRLKAAQIVAPSGASVVKVGKGALGDQYHFRLASRIGTALSDRVAVDQDGNVNFWGDLIVTGSALAPIALNVAGEVLIIKALPSAGAQIRWRSYIDETTENNLVLEFRDLFKQRDLLVLPVGTNEGADNIPEIIKQFNATAKLVNVQLQPRNNGGDDNERFFRFALPNIPIPIPILHPQRPSNEGPAATGVKTKDNHDTDFRYQSPSIVFEPENPNVPHVFCGCDDEVEKLFVLPNGIGFRAGVAPPRVPARDVYSIKVGEDEQQHEQLRAALGNFEEGDLGRRFSVGSMQIENNAPEFNPWLIVRGNAAVELPGGQTDGNGLPFVMLDVKGTLRLPPVTPDPRDPVFKSLLLLTFLTGVLSHGASPVSITVTDLPTFVESGQDFVYTIQVTNQDFVQKLEDIKGTDRFIGHANTHSLNLPGTAIDPRANRSYVITHQPADFQGLDELSVDVFIEAQMGNRKVAGKITTTPPVPVIESPFIDLTMIPAEVPAGWSTPILIENRADRALTIVGNLVARGLGPDQQLQPTSTVLQASENTDTTTALLVPKNIAGNQNLEVELTYHWPAPPTNRTTKTTQAVLVTKLLAVSTVGTPVPNGAWTFGLEFSNTTGRQVRLLELKVTVTAPNEAPRVVNFELDEVIRNNQTFTQSGIDGIIGPSGTIETIDLQMSLRYRRKDWDPVVDSLSITIP
ncbi:MAG TPA: hypothetical protein VJ751_02085 [Pyrinomonadaceae bacterium]|nr:hypothetical protein [Pyrinomonadaceae bacterium]